MSSLSGTVLGIFAAAHVESGALVGSFTVQRGFVGVPVKNGVGDYTLTFQDQLDSNRAIVGLTVQDQGGGGARGNITGEAVGLTGIRVRSFLGGVASDQHFWIKIEDMGPG